MVAGHAACRPYPLYLRNVGGAYERVEAGAVRVAGLVQGVDYEGVIV